MVRFIWYDCGDVGEGRFIDLYRLDVGLLDVIEEYFLLFVVGSYGDYVADLGFVLDFFCWFVFVFRYV